MLEWRSFQRILLSLSWLHHVVKSCPASIAYLSFSREEKSSQVHKLPTELIWNLKSYSKSYIVWENFSTVKALLKLDILYWLASFCIWNTTSLAHKILARLSPFKYFYWTVVKFSTLYLKSYWRKTTKTWRKCSLIFSLKYKKLQFLCPVTVWRALI